MVCVAFGLQAIKTLMRWIYHYLISATIKLNTGRMKLDDCILPLKTELRSWENNFRLHNLGKTISKSAQLISKFIRCIKILDAQVTIHCVLYILEESDSSKSHNFQLQVPNCLTDSRNILNHQLSFITKCLFIKTVK